ncbi:MAG: hypothetical protein WBN40_13925 [Pseudomonadales bacterium]
MNPWTVYLLALATLGLLAFWLSRRWLHWSTRLVALAVFIVPLLVPVTVTENADRAPAWIVATFEYLFGSEAEAQRAALPLAAVGVAALLAFAVFLFVRRGRSDSER